MLITCRARNLHLHPNDTWAENRRLFPLCRIRKRWASIGRARGEKRKILLRSGDFVHKILSFRAGAWAKKTNITNDRLWTQALAQRNLLINLLDCNIAPDCQSYSQRYWNGVEDLRKLAVEKHVDGPAVTRIRFICKKIIGRETKVWY